VIAVVVVNYRQTAATIACLESLVAHAGCPFDLYLVDNAADQTSTDAFAELAAAFRGAGQAAILISNRENLGFAVGCNQALAPILAERRYAAVALLNNDTCVETDWLKRLVEPFAPERAVCMVACTMLDLERPEHVDSLGIVIYRSGIASNRKHLNEPLVGPCGGAGLYGTDMLRQIRARDGFVFDPDFFCYAEDTDLALRARFLGYSCAFAGDAVVRHHGQLSTGGGFNDFVAYHGLRNSLFALTKNMPAGFLLRNLAWILFMQVAVIIRYVIKGRPGLVWRIYRDYFKRLPHILKQRKRMKKSSSSRHQDWRTWTCARFYDRGYVLSQLKSLHKRDLQTRSNDSSGTR
jgi:GT2 family glycosyltransferase